MGRWYYKEEKAAKKYAYKHEEWLAFSSLIFLALKGTLSDFDREFLVSIDKRLGYLSVKQKALLIKILGKIFGQKHVEEKIAASVSSLGDAKGVAKVAGKK